MNIDRLRELLYLAETLGFVATARHFFISSSALSKRVAAMEDNLQVQLFERDSRRVTLTDDGEAFYRDIVPVVDGFDRAVAHLETRRSYVELRFRVGCLRGAA